jgi:hypothetical protein
MTELQQGLRERALAEIAAYETAQKERDEREKREWEQSRFDRFERTLRQAFPDRFDPEEHIFFFGDDGSLRCTIDDLTFVAGAAVGVYVGVPCTRCGGETLRLLNIANGSPIENILLHLGSILSSKHEHNYDESCPPRDAEDEREEQKRLANIAEYRRLGESEEEAKVRRFGVALRDLLEEFERE